MVVVTPVTMSPLNTTLPVGEPWAIATLCGIPESLFVNWIWNGCPAGAVMSVWSNAMFCALILMTVPAGAPLGAADAPPLGAGAALPPGDADAPGDELGVTNADFQQSGTGVADGGGTKFGSRQPEICAG